MRAALALLLLLSPGCDDGGATADDAGVRDDAGAVDARDGGAEDAGPGGCFGPVERLAVPGGATDVAVAADRAVVGSPSALHVVSLDPPALGASAPGAALQVLASGGRAVAYDGAFMVLFDGLDATPIERGRVDVAGEATAGIAADRLVVYRHPAMARINVIEITSLADLAMPAALGSVDIRGTQPARLAIAGDVAHVLDTAGASGELVLVDVADPAAPAELARLAVAGARGDSRVAVDGALAYVGADGEAVIVDVGDTSAPREVTRVDGAPILALGGGRLAAVSEVLRVYATDASGTPTLLETRDVTPATGAAWRGDTLIVTTAEGVELHPWTCP